MKKLLCLVLSLVLVAALGLGVAQGATFLAIATGGTSGTYYPLGGDIANLFSKTISGLEVTAQATGGSMENLRLIDKGDAELGTVQNDVAAYAYKGEDSFAGEVIQSFSVVASMYPEIVQLVVSADAGVETVADLKGKRVSIGAAGSGTYFNALHIFGSAGLTLDDVDEQYLSFAESVDAIKNRQIDAAFITAGIPNPAVTELASTHAIKLMPIDDATIEALQAEKPFYVKYIVPANTYAGIETDTQVVALMALLVCSNDLDEELVYNMTKALFESQDLLTHAKKSEITLETALDGVSVPLHPGAEKYYREVGLIKE